MNSQKILQHSFLITTEGLLKELSETKPKKKGIVKKKTVVHEAVKPKPRKEKAQKKSEVKPLPEEDMTYFNEHFETLIENDILRESLNSLGKALKRERKLFNEQLKHSQSKLTEKIRLLEDDKQRLIQEQEELKATAETEQTETKNLATRLQRAAGLNPYTEAEKQETSKDESI